MKKVASSKDMDSIEKGEAAQSKEKIENLTHLHPAKEQQTDERKL